MGAGKLLSSGYCQNMPRRWSYYLTKSNGANYTLRIGNGDANDNLEGLGGNKSLYHHLVTNTTGGGGGSPDDAQLNWHYNSTTQNRYGVPEMWVRYRERVSDDWTYDNPGGDGTNQMKLGRMGHYFGDGTFNNGDGDAIAWPSNLNDECYMTFSYYNTGQGGQDNAYHQMSGRSGS